MGVGAGIGLFAGGNWDDETGFGRERSVFRTVVRTGIAINVVGFSDRSWSRVIGVSDRGQRFSTLYFVITPRDTFIGWNRGDGGLKFVGGSGGQVEVEFMTFRGGQPEQARVEVEQVLGCGVHTLGSQP